MEKNENSWLADDFEILSRGLDVDSKQLFCAIVLYLLVYHVCCQNGKLCLLVVNDKLDGK
jgi:hypothetical protein